MKKISISVVSYANTLPFIQGIKNSSVMDLIELSSDYPSECARRVINNEVDMGIIPVAALTKLSEYHIIGDYCIGSDGAVNSVFIYSQKPIEEISTLLLDIQSRTSNGLARILLKHYWKKDVQIVTEGPSDAFVLIGDRTFGQDNLAPYIYDLGHFWKEFTGLPFAYAVWVSNKKLPETFVKEFNLALAEGVSHATDVIGDINKVEGFDYVSYLTEYLDFNLTDGKREAIDRYLSFYRDL